MLRDEQSRTKEANSGGVGGLCDERGLRVSIRPDCEQAVRKTSTQVYRRRGGANFSQEGREGHGNRSQAAVGRKRVSGSRSRLVSGREGETSSTVGGYNQFQINIILNM